MLDDGIEQIKEMDRESIQEGKEGLREVLARSARDWEFRQKLLSKPREAIAEHTGQDLEEIPETIDLAFVENEADATVVLPDLENSEAELNEDELEDVAGGIAVSTGAAIVMCASAFAGGVALGSAMQD